jgi:phosphoribosylformylglycinamidine synthase
VLLVGEVSAGLAGSEYSAVAGLASEDGPPLLDLERERRLQAFVRDAAGRELLASAQDVSAGGLAVAVAESAIWGNDDRGIGARLKLPVRNAPAVELFGESPSRIVVSAPPRHAPALVLLARQHGLPIEELGIVGGERLVIELAGSGATGAAEERGSRVADALDVSLAELRHAWEQGLNRALGWEEFAEMGA